MEILKGPIYITLDKPNTLMRGEVSVRFWHKFDFARLSVGFITFSFLFLSSCEDNLSIGFPSKQPKLITTLIDTFQISSYTIILDSIATSGTGRILVGEYQDNTVGKLSSSAYFMISPRPGFPFTPPASNVRFDSVCLIMKYDGYWYGDTLTTQELIVHELNSNIRVRQVPSHIFGADYPLPQFSSFRALYNNSVTTTMNDPVGMVTYSPTPRSRDSLVVRLSDELGKDWFTLGQENDSRILLGNFSEYFKGISVSSGTANSSLVGFSAESTYVRIYYSTFDGNGFPRSTFYDFPLSNDDLQYNEVSADRSGTPWEGLQPLVEIPGTQTSNETFLQGGDAVMTKIKIPELNQLGNLETDFVVVSAQLIVRPITSSSTDNSLPPALALYRSTANNVAIQPLEDDLRNSIVGTLRQDFNYNNSTRYTFNLTDYIRAWKANPAKENGELLIGLTPTAMVRSGTRARIHVPSGAEQSIRLELYISRFNNGY